MSSTKNNVAKPKQGIFSRIVGFFSGVGSELKKVTWPTKKELVNYEVVVITFSLLAAVFIWIFDIAFRTGITELIKL